jgi:hypothetical protein
VKHGDLLAFGPLEFRAVVAIEPAEINVASGSLGATPVSGRADALLGAGTADTRAEEIAYQALSAAGVHDPSVAETLPEVAAQAGTDTAPMIPTARPAEDAAAADSASALRPSSDDSEQDTGTGNGTFKAMAPPPTARLKPTGSYEGVSKAANDILAKMVARAQAGRRFSGPPRAQD